MYISPLFTRWIILLLILLASSFSKAQYVHGVLSDTQGQPLPFASVYLKASTTGVSTNLKGKYIIDLKPGSYTLVFSFVGYETQEKQVTLTAQKPVQLNVRLIEKATDLEEFRLVTDKRDLAKEIMKKVRDKRKYYLDQVSSYKCQSYLKTSLEKELVNPKMSDTLEALEQLDSTSESKDVSSFFDKQKLNLVESASTTYFEEPRKYKEVIQAYNDYTYRGEPNFGQSVSVGVDIGENDIAPVQYASSNPYMLFDGADGIALNFYRNRINYPSICQKPLLSPIATTGPLSYIYDFAGSFIQKGKKVHKIAVKPILKQEALFYGTIFIEDSTWALLSVDLFINPSVLLFCKEFRIIQNYIQLGPDQYLPTRRELNYTIKDGRYHFLGSTRVDHSQYEVNVTFPPRFFNNEIQRYEPDAFDKDSSFWSKLRPISLQQKELDFITESDSMAAYYTSDEYYRKLDSAFNRVTFWLPLTGYGHRNRARGTEFYIAGLPEQVIPFGVGGYRHRLPGYFNKEFKNNVLLETEGFLDYGFKNQDIRGKAGIGLTYVPKKFVRTFVRVGDYYDLINNFASIEQTFSRSNFMRTQTYSIAQRMEVMNGLFAELTFDHSSQKPLNNLQLSRWSEDLFGDLNTPAVFEPYIKTEIKLEAKYRIKQQYIIKKNKKIIVGTDYPEITFLYRKGLPNAINSEVNFDFIQAGTRGDIPVARWGLSRWQVLTGSFINKKNLRLLEYKYFRGSDQYFFSDPLRSFQLLGPTLNTADAFFQANYIHHFEGTLLNKVPVINRLKLETAAGTGTLLMPAQDFAHFEMFAGLEKAVRIKKQLFRFGVYAVTADNTLEDANVRIKFGIDFFNTFTQKWSY